MRKLGGDLWYERYFTKKVNEGLLQWRPFFSRIQKVGERFPRKQTVVNILASLQMFVTGRLGDTIDNMSDIEKEKARRYFKSFLKDDVYVLERSILVR